MSDTILILTEKVLIATVAVAIVMWIFSRPGRARTEAGRVALVGILLLIACSLIGSHRVVTIDALLLDAQLR